MKLSQRAKSLIYKYSNTIIIESFDIEEIVNEIEAIRNDSKLEGYIFRPAFAETVEFKEYTDADWFAIYDQWSISFGWSNTFENITKEAPNKVLEAYYVDMDTEPFTPLITEENTPKVERIEFVENLIKSFMEAKSVLNSHQMEIIASMPADILIKAYRNSTITIREIRTAVVSKILEKDKRFKPFDNIADIIPLLVEIYSIKNTYNGKKIDKSVLNNVKIRVPRSMKRKVIEVLVRDYKKNIAIDNFKKYQSFWKRVLRQILIDNSFDKTVVQYPEFKEIHSLVYSSIKTNNSKIEAFRKNGLLKEAFELEMKNVGQMLRNIMFYLRYQKGDNYARKADIKRIMPTPVRTDIGEIINSSEFADVLMKANPKLLSQVKTLIGSEGSNKDREMKMMNNVWFIMKHLLNRLLMNGKTKFLCLLKMLIKRLRLKKIELLEKYIYQSILKT